MGGTNEAELTNGEVVRIKGRQGLWRAVEPCKDKTEGKNWWFLPCDRQGRWTMKDGWRAFRVDQVVRRKRR